MTPRSILLGLLGVVALCSFNYLNDNVLKQTFLLGNYLPVAVYGGLIVVAVVVNPLLARISRRLLLGGAEIAVALAIVLAACCIPGDSLMRCFTTSILLPHHFNRTNPGWQEKKVLEQFPARMLADPTGNEDRVVNGFVQGLGDANRHVRVGDVPWSAWARTLAFWLPLLLSLWFALIALSVVVHRQWSDHELLPYPIADFANSLLPAAGEAVSPLLRTRAFWVTTGVVFLLHFNNFLYTFWPDYLIAVKREFDFTAIITRIPYLQSGGGWILLRPTVFFTVIGFAYFVPKDVSFSLGLGPYAWCILNGFLMSYGFSLTAPLEGTSWYLDLKPQTFVLFGANLAVFAVILYCGRQHYTEVFLRACCLPARGGGEHPAPSSTVWAGRLFLLGMVLFVAQMVAIGLDWQLAVLYAAVTVVFYVVVSRVFAETGLFYSQPYFFPCVAVWGLLGTQALGPRTLGIMLLLTTVIMVDPRESVMPLIVNSLKLLDHWRLSLPRAAWWFALALVVGLMVAVPVTLYLQYDLGYAKWDTWAGESVPQMACKNVATVTEKLQAMGCLDQARAASGWERFRQMQPNLPCLVTLAAGFVVALLVYVARLRIPGWPLHPVLFLTWPTWPAYLMCGSFLIGWVVKAAVVRYGGGAMYQRLKPVFLGLIVGEVFGAFVPTVVGVFYYWATGSPPAAFRVLPS